MNCYEFIVVNNIPVSEFRKNPSKYIMWVYKTRQPLAIIRDGAVFVELQPVPKVQEDTETLRKRSSAQKRRRT